MKKVLVLVFMLGTFPLLGQTVVQTYTDRCTGEVYTFTFNAQAPTTVVFYNRARSFTSADVASGVFKAWLDETYNWWRTLNPCSVNQVAATTAVQTTQQVATAAIPSPPPPSQSASGSTSTSSQGGTQDGGSSSSSSENSSSDSSSSESNTEQQSESESESSSESTTEEDSEEDSSKKKSANPPILVSNVAAMQSVDGGYTPVATFGITKSSLLGDESFGLNSMVWLDLNQFMVTGNYIKSGRVKEIGVTHMTSVAVIQSYSTHTRVVTHGKVFGLKNGFVVGTALTSTRTSFVVDDDRNREKINTTSSLVFATKTITKSRLSVTPLLAAATQLLFIERIEKNVTVPFTTLYVSALDVNYALTRRFVANLGANTAFDVKGTIPFLLNVTIGSRMVF